MFDEPTRTGIFVGLLVVAVSMGLHARRQIRPRFNDMTVLLLASVGGTVGIDFGYTVATATAQHLGQLEQHRLTMILGAIAVVWVSVESVIDLYVKFGKLTNARTLSSTDGVPGKNHE